MQRTRSILLILSILIAAAASAAAAADRPNVIFILADDLGYGDLGSYGQQVIRTPVLDRMAAEGIRFTQFYAGATVCAPSRSVLMTGWHTGRTHVRGNAAGTAQSLRDEDVTVADLADMEAPSNTDSISFVPTLRGRPGDQEAHDYLYWEFYEAGSAQAVRLRQWKGVRKPMLTGGLELYDVSRDPGEKYDVARNHPEVVEDIERIMAAAHEPHPNWRPPSGR